MMKITFNLTILFLIICGTVQGQVGIGIDTPDPSSNLHVAPTNSAKEYKGTLLGTMTSSERDMISQPASGLIIFNITDNCLQINEGTPDLPKWKCLLNEDDSVFSEMTTALYKPIYPGLPGASSLASNGSPPTYSNSDAKLYGKLTQNGSFAQNDLFRIEVGYRTGDTFTSILYNKSGGSLSFSFNTNAYHNPETSSKTLANNQGFYIDGDYITYYREAQNIYVTVTSGVHAGRKFLVGLNIFKLDSTDIAMGGNGSGKQNQAMLTYIYEFK
ncbi:hypothetical protein JET18_20645 [Chryseobacterium sp. L7]|uniref:Uncharacterized protein n=1 Tax=Chryseobacterium endalhagicum TaxID=2797638 RepID=A0ABS1QLP0_9FLAO|nr:hypothetical protein [Chryseobacterium endalhagicum]MBL1223262.1 hypothetical protein [Chryseobacterium endalhagicum]